MNAKRKTQTALRPSVCEARLEDRLVMTAFTFQGSFVIPHAMISVGPLSNVHTPVMMDFNVSSLVQPKPSISVGPLANISKPVVMNFSMTFGTPGHYNPFNPSDRSGFGPTHSR